MGGREGRKKAGSFLGPKQPSVALLSGWSQAQGLMHVPHSAMHLSILHL